MEMWFLQMLVINKSINVDMMMIRSTGYQCHLHQGTSFWSADFTEKHLPRGFTVNNRCAGATEAGVNRIHLSVEKRVRPIHFNFYLCSICLDPRAHAVWNFSPCGWLSLFSQLVWLFHLYVISPVKRGGRVDVLAEMITALAECWPTVCAKIMSKNVKEYVVVRFLCL